jgi:hypothetical protein
VLLQTANDFRIAHACGHDVTFVDLEPERAQQGKNSRTDVPSVRPYRKD